MSDLRIHAVETLNLLRNKDIDTIEAGVTAKVYDSIISSCKAEMEYAKLKDCEVDIKFLEDAPEDNPKTLENTRPSFEVKRLNDK
jgi:hypothetical protein